MSQNIPPNEKTVICFISLPYTIYHKYLEILYINSSKKNFNGMNVASYT